MKCVCMFLLLVVLLILQRKPTNQINIYEGLDVPDRIIDASLSDYLSLNNNNELISISTPSQSSSRPILDPYTQKNNQRNTIEAIFAKHNMKECKDSGIYSGCSLPSPSIPKIDYRYVNIPTNKLNNSDIYTKLSICPKTYQKNMEILKNKPSIGQYSGYTPNEYIDKIRYINVPSSNPLPVNPDFFVKNGGTY